MGAFTPPKAARALASSSALPRRPHLLFAESLLLDSQPTLGSAA